MIQESHCWVYTDKTLIQKDTYTFMFTAALLTIAKTWKQPKFPSTDEWIKKCYMYTMKKDEIMPFATTWMQLEIITLSEVSQKEKDKYCILSLVCGIQNMTEMNLSMEQKQESGT